MAINFNKAEFVLSAVRASTFIRDGKPQVTFAGRSNVGKSSVINRLLGRKNFARVGATPGKTNQINYFDIDGKIYFTDLPGYGYAKVSKEERDRWGRLMESYFAEPDLITLGVLIVAARHKPTAEKAAASEYENPGGLPQADRRGFAGYWSSCSSASNSGVEKNSPRVMSRPSQSILMVSSLGFWLLP